MQPVNEVWLPRGFEFLSGLPTPARKRRVLMPFQVFADESEARNKGQYLVMGGALADATEWARFTDLWQTVLDIEPSVPAFHTYDAIKRNKKFRRWSSAERESRIRQLIEVVNDFDLRGLFVAIDTAVYKELFGAMREELNSFDSLGKDFVDEVKLMKAFTDPYFFCFQFMVLGAARELHRLGLRERFEIIFDERGSVGRRVRQYYPAMKSLVRPEYRAIMPIDPLFHTDEEFRPLQLTDLIAVLTRLKLDTGATKWDWIMPQMTGLKWTREQLVLDREWFEKAQSQNRGVSRDRIQDLLRLIGMSPLR